jgi:hypothetical protein
MQNKFYICWPNIHWLYKNGVLITILSDVAFFEKPGSILVIWSFVLSLISKNYETQDSLKMPLLVYSYCRHKLTQGLYFNLDLIYLV